ncbi:hypothetical protein CA600_04710 [Paenibacillus sp. VTT E-133280]|nr:hypothetical protein CA600_04710 [Paenibacillus sp. VTT E-133280]
MIRMIITFFLAMIPSVLAIFLLIQYFPYTGLARIGSIPTTFFLNTLILLLSLHFTKKIKSRVYKSLIWITVISISILLAIGLHPQEYLPSVLSQISKLIFPDTIK